MLKYLYHKEIFREMPDEISLGISISGCKIHCKGCHSPELWEDVGKPLTWSSLNALINIHKGITCLVLLGGEHDIDALTELFYRAQKYIKTAWYCGLKEIPKNKIGILQFLDYIKLGPYIQELGGLDNPNTNQRFYRINYKGENDYDLEDITNKFWKKKC